MCIRDSTHTHTHRHTKEEPLTNPQTLTRNVLFSYSYARGDKNHLSLASCKGKCYRPKRGDSVGRLTLKISKLLKVLPSWSRIFGYFFDKWIKHTCLMPTCKVNVIDARRGTLGPVGNCLNEHTYTHTHTHTHKPPTLSLIHISEPTRP